MGIDDGQSKVVQEAKKIMNDEDDDDNAKVGADNEDTGPGIRMGRLGGKKKKKRGQPTSSRGGDEQKAAFTQKLGGFNREATDLDMRGQEGFKEEDIEFMRKAIQVLCQSTNPLGKSIDFVTDDVESMSMEYKMWRQEAIACNNQLEEAKKVTEELVQPLQDQLAELEEKIREQQSKVNSMESQILRNDISINNMLYSVIQNK